MKQFLIIFTLLFSQLSYAGVGETVSNAIDSTKAAVKEGISVVDTSSNFKAIYSDIKDGISALASGLKVGAEHVYEVLVKQQVVNAITYLVIGILALILMLNFIKRYKDLKEKWITDDGEPSIIGVIRVLQMILACLLFIIFLFNVDNIIMGFVNPEYGAIETIIDIVKENK